MMIFRARHSRTGDRVTCLNVNAEMSLTLTEQKNVIVFLKKKLISVNPNVQGHPDPPRT